MLTISKTFQETTPESLEHGDFSDQGFIFSDEQYTFQELVDLINSDGYTETSCCPVSSVDNLGDIYISTECEVTNWTTGEDRSCSLHINIKNKRDIKYWKKALHFCGLLNN